MREGHAGCERPRRRGGAATKNRGGRRRAGGRSRAKPPRVQSLASPITDMAGSRSKDTIGAFLAHDRVVLGEEHRQAVHRPCLPAATLASRNPGQGPTEPRNRTADLRSVSGDRRMHRGAPPDNSSRKQRSGVDSDRQRDPIRAWRPRRTRSRGGAGLGRPGSRGATSFALAGLVSAGVAGLALADARCSSASSPARMLFRAQARHAGCPAWRPATSPSTVVRIDWPCDGCGKCTTACRRCTTCGRRRNRSRSIR